MTDTPPSAPVERTTTCAVCGHAIPWHRCSFCDGNLCVHCCHENTDRASSAPPPPIISTGLHACRTVAQLKAVLANWPEKHHDGTPTLIQIRHQDDKYLDTMWIVGSNPKINEKDETTFNLCAYAKHP